MSAKTAYALTFLSYALIHSVRTGWSYSKNYMQLTPFLFSTQFLGELDLTVLIFLAISLKTIGWVGEKIGYKPFLLIGMAILTILCIITAVLILKGVTSHVGYIFLLCATGISMCTGWPSCLSIVSRFYPPHQKSFQICVWNGCSQFGDLVAVVMGYIIIQWYHLSHGYLMLALGVLIGLTMVINWIFLLPNPIVQSVPEAQVASNQQLPRTKEQSEQASKNSQHSGHSIKNQSPEIQPHQQRFPPDSQQVNFLNVWCLPSVISFVCCYACLKAVNAIIMNWMFLYLFSIGLHKLSGLITLAWSLSIFVGNLIMGYYNKTTSKTGMIVPLVFAGFVFGYLGVQYQRSGSMNYLVLLILSGVCFGGPFGIIGSKVPLLLGDHPQIKHRKNALGSIISLMQGFGQFVAAFFVLVIPYLGLRRMFYLPTMLCVVSCGILLYEHKKGLRLSKRQRVRARQIQLKQIN